MSPVYEGQFLMSEEKMFKVTEKAIDELNKVFAEQKIEKEKIGVRFGIAAGGCSGFQYKFDFQALDLKKENDKIVDIEGIQFMIDAKSALFLDEVVIDFKDSLSERGFSFENPLAVRTCGCNKSFGM